MNRSRRYNQNPKNFVAGGVYDGNQQFQQNQGYQQNYQSTNQQQEQQQPQPQQLQSQLQQQPQLQQQLKQQQQKTYQQQIKDEEEKQNAQVEQQDQDMDGSVGEQQDGEFLNEKGKPLFKRIFGDRKKSSARTREKKIRQNRRLRKAITPKNALMALNEVKGIQMSDFTVNSNPSGGFIAVVTINNTQYEGRGPAKAAAKNNACEKALRDYVIEKMLTKPRLSKANSESSVVPMEDEPVEKGDSAKDTTNTNEEDDVPMVNLASFALFKLFSEWESEGFVIPEMHRSATNGTDTNGAAAPASEPKKPPPIRKELPADWEKMHPATLLCMMRPGLQYQSLGSVGEKPNETQNVSVVVDGREFKASGRSKKIARRNAAVMVCNTLFNTNFIIDEAAA